MLIQLLEILKKQKNCTLQELAELTGEDLDSIKMKIEYLENNGYIKKVEKNEISMCQKGCSNCNNCIIDNDKIWILVE